MTVSVWFKANSIAHMSIVDKMPRSDQASNGWRIGTRNNGDLWFQYGSASSGSNTAIAPAAYTTGTWYFVTTTYDGTSLKIYINGVLAGSTASTRTYTATGESLNIGRNNY